MKSVYSLLCFLLLIDSGAMVKKQVGNRFSAHSMRDSFVTTAKLNDTGDLDASRWEHLVR